EPRDYSFKLNKKLKRTARKSALTYKAQAGKITVVEDFSFEAPKTKAFLSFLTSLNVADKKVLLILPETNANVYLSSRNIANANVIIAAELNTYEVLDAENVIV